MAGNRNSIFQWLSIAKLWLGARPTTRRLKHILEYLVYRMALACVRLVPLDRAASILASLCRRYSSRSRRHLRALANLERAFPEKAAVEREAIALAMWENVGRVIAEAAHINTFLSEPHRYDPIDMRLLDVYLPGRGLSIVASLHTGNWEIGLLPSFLRGFKPAAFYRTIANPYVERHVKASREKIYCSGLFPVRGEVQGRVRADMRSRQLDDCLRRGAPVGILTDQYDHDGIVVPFFGSGIRVSRGPATLAIQFRARLCVARTVRIGRHSCFIGEAVEITLPDSGDRHANVHAATAAIMRHFETWIRQFPEQWLWSQAPFTASDAIEPSAGPVEAGIQQERAP